MGNATNIKAIETVYNGYRFRSRLEARWAVFFDTLGIRYEYEKEGYDLGELGWYLPDFWLPSLDAWVEVKGDEPTKDEQLKLARLTATRTNVVGIIRHKMPDPVANCGYVFWQGKYIGWQTFVQCIDCGTVGFISQFPDEEPVSDEWKKMLFQRLRCKSNCLHEIGFTTDTPLIHAAYTAARQARFEHGERG